MADRILMLCDRDGGVVARRLVALGFDVERVDVPNRAVDRLAADPRPLVVSASTVRAAKERCQAVGWASGLPVTAIVPEPSPRAVTELLAAGAGSVLSSETDRRELAARIRAQCRVRAERPQRVAGSDARAGSLTVDERRHTATLAGGRELSLTPTEFRLLAALARRRGQLVAHHELIDEVWGKDAPEGTKKLRLYVGYLRNKLAAANEERAVVVNQRGVGYRLAEAGAS